LWKKAKSLHPNGHCAPEGSIGPRGLGTCPAVLANMARVATAGTAATMVFSVDEEPDGNGTGIVHCLHKVREGEQGIMVMARWTTP